MDYPTFYARWQRLWYIRAPIPYEVKTALVGILPRPRPALRELDGFRMALDVTDLLQANILLDGRWEPEVGEPLRRLAATAQTIVDVGAHVGYFTLLARAAAPPDARLFAFEPNPATCEGLRRNLALNGADNVQVVPAALGRAAGERRLHIRRRLEPGNSSLLPLPYADAGISVPTLTLDAFCHDRGLTQVDLVKIDAEGAEPDILLGMQEGLASGLYRALIVALHPRFWPDRAAAEAAIRSLADCGYALYTLRDGAPAPLGGDRLPDGELLALAAAGPFGLPE